VVREKELVHDRQLLCHPVTRLEFLVGKQTALRRPGDAEYVLAHLDGGDPVRRPLKAVLWPGQRRPLIM